METALQQFGTLPVGRKEIDQFIEKLVTEAISGEHDPVRLEIYLSVMEKIVKSVRKDNRFKDTLFREAVKHGKSFEMMGASVQLMERKKYQYDACNDDVLNDLNEQLSKVTEMIKQRENALQAGIDTDGVVLTKPAYSTTEYTKITFK